MTTPIRKNNELNDIGCLVVINEKISSSIVINDDILNKEDAIGDQIINVKEVEKVKNLQTLILPQKSIQNKIIPVSKSFNFLQLPKYNRKKFMFL